MKTRFVIFSDLHIDNYSRFNNKHSRLDNTLFALEDMFEYCNRNEVDIIINGGDLFNKSYLDGSVIYRTYIMLNKLFKQYPNIKLLSITGNHELEFKNIYPEKPTSSILWLKSVFSNNFFIIDNKNIELHGITIYGIPYYEYPEMFYQALESFGEIEQESILICHQMTPFENLPCDIDWERPIFTKFKRIFVGHIHAHYNFKNITSIGSPLGRDFGDVNHTNKGFIFYDYLSESIRKIDLKYPKFIYTDDELFEDDFNYFKFIPKETEVVIEKEEAEIINSYMKKEDIITNYLNAIGNKDNDILSTGLKLIRE
jgi:DNA repair exonuclease SbcCD nuclease subunit